MTIENNDRLLVNRGSTSHQIKYEKIKQDITESVAGSVNDAPVDGKQYGRQDSGWTEIVHTPEYTNADVDAHLNTNLANGGQVLSWNGTDYTWVADQTGGGSGGDSSLISYQYPGGVSRSVQNRLEDRVSPMDFGAIGDGVADDSDALEVALNINKPVDGAGKTYLVTRNITAGENFISLRNCTITRPDLGAFVPSDSDPMGWVLRVTDGGFVIDNVTFIYGDSPERARTGDNGGINNYIGLLVQSEDSSSSPNDFTVQNCRFTGNGSGCHLQIRGCNNFSINNCHAFNSNAKDLQVTDDIMQGLAVDDSSFFTFSNCSARRLLCWERRDSSVTGAPTQNTYSPIHTRGFVVSRSSNYSLTGCHAEMVDQGYDVTGSRINTRYTFTACTADTCGTNGFKSANGPSYGVFTGCIARQIGGNSFLVDANEYVMDGAIPILRDDTTPILRDDTTDSHDVARFISFTGCKVIDAGYVTAFDWSKAHTGSYRGTTGFAINRADATDAVQLPLRCELSACSVFQENVAVDNAFFSSQEIPYLTQDTYDTDRNPRGTVVANCYAHSFNQGSIGTDFAGPIGPMFGRVTLASDVEISGYSSGEFTNILWTASNQIEDDRFNLHNPNDRPQRIYIRDSGIYSVNGTIIVRHDEDGKTIDGVLLQLDNGNEGEIFSSGTSNAAIQANVPVGTTIAWTGYLKKGTWITLGIVPLLGSNPPSSLKLKSNSYLSLYRNP